MELLKFVFSSFWYFIGTIILLSTLFKGMAEILKGVAAIIQASQKNSENSVHEEESYTEASYEVVEE